MSVLEQFLLFNLAPSLATGVAVLIVVLAGSRLLGIRHGALRTCLLTAPLIKSTLALVGLTVVLAWPQELFRGLNRAAVPADTVLPYYVAVGVIVMGVRFLLMRRSRSAALTGTMPAERSSPRLVGALDRVMAAYAANDSRINGLCPCAPLPRRPQLMTTDRPISSPIAITTGPPAIVFPDALIAELEDEEIEGALAHEIAHFRLRRPACCSSEHVRTLSLLNPFAAMLARQLRREEETACDDIAVTAVGRPDVYAGMLVKTYRFAGRRGRSLPPRLHALLPLLGARPLVSERVERLVKGPPPEERLAVQYAATVALWSGLAAVFFTS